MNARHKYATIALLIVIVVLAELVIKAYWPKETPTVGLSTIRPIAELAIVEYSTVVESQNEDVPNDLRAWFGEKESVLLLVYAKVKAGFDLNGFSKDDIQVNGKQVRITLPHPKILSVTVDNSQTHVVYYDKTWLVRRNINLETKAREMADSKLTQKALEDGILEKAAAYGKLLFENKLRAQGFTDVQVEVK